MAKGNSTHYSSFAGYCIQWYVPLNVDFPGMKTLGSTINRNIPPGMKEGLAVPITAD
jgi:hypothetical protein